MFTMANNLNGHQNEEVLPEAPLAPEFSMSRRSFIVGLTAMSTGFSSGCSSLLSSSPETLSAEAKLAWSQIANKAQNNESTASSFQDDVHTVMSRMSIINLKLSNSGGEVSLDDICPEEERIAVLRGIFGKYFENIDEYWNSETDADALLRFRKLSLDAGLDVNAIAKDEQLQAASAKVIQLRFGRIAQDSKKAAAAENITDSDHHFLVTLQDEFKIIDTFADKMQLNRELLGIQASDFDAVIEPHLQETWNALKIGSKENPISRSTEVLYQSFEWAIMNSSIQLETITDITEEAAVKRKFAMQKLNEKPGAVKKFIVNLIK